MGGQIEVKNAATIMGQDQKHVKDVETDVGDSVEIDRPYLPTGGKIFLLNSMTKELARATGLEPAASCETGQSSDLAYLGEQGHTSYALLWEARFTGARGRIRLHANQTN